MRDVSTFLSAPATVVNRGLYYAGATGASASSSLSDKVALLPGQASTFSNYSNYSRGLNGIAVDINRLPATTTNTQFASSLQFANWNGIDVAGFVALPGAAIPSVNIVPGGGSGGSARVQITFPDNTIQNTWLRVTVLANANTALTANDVFYFGNVIGELDFGNTATRLRVNGQDAALILANQSPGANSANVTNKFDLDRNGRVNGQDYAILLANQQAAGIVAPITAPSSRSAASRAFAAYNGGANAPLPFPRTATKSEDGSDSNIANQGTFSGQFMLDRDSMSQVRFLSEQAIALSGKEIASPLVKAKEKEDSAKDSRDKYFASLWEDRLL